VGMQVCVCLCVCFHISPMNMNSPVQLHCTMLIWHNLIYNMYVVSHKHVLNITFVTRLVVDIM
jgi:hypothetical protein